MRQYAIDILREKGSVRCFDEHGREVNRITWIDEQAGTYGQLITDEEGQIQKDPHDPDKAWEITRMGRLTLKPEL